MHVACAYGLTIHSAIALPHLLQGGDGAPDVTISFGSVPEDLPGATRPLATMQVTPDAVVVDTHDAGRFLVREGREVVVDRAAGASDDAVRVYLLGTVLGVVLHARRLLPLHASAIRTPHGAVVFAGRSGAGKSTLLTALTARGYAMLADDVTAVGLGADGRPQVLPAYPTARLWRDSVRALGHAEDGLMRMRPDLEKFHLPIAAFAAEPVPLHAVYVMRVHNGSDIAFEHVAPAAGLALVAEQTYRKRLMRGLGALPDHFRTASAVARCARIAAVARPVLPLRIEPLAERIVADFTARRPADGLAVPA